MKILIGVGVALLILVLGVNIALAPPQLAVPPRQDRVISHVTVFNPGTPLAPNQSIDIKGGVITAIRPAKATDPAPICKNCIVMPGLIDAHVHFPPALLKGNQELFALMYLAHGVTSIRDVGEVDDSVADLATRLNAGQLVGPHMYRCGPVLEGSPPAWPSAQMIRSPSAAEDIVDDLAASGVDCLKIYNETAPDVYASLAKAAARHSLPLIGHVPHKVGLKNIRDFEAQHMTGLPYVVRARPPVGTDIAAADILAMRETELRAALTLAQENHVAFTPTLANFDLRLSASDSVRFPPPDALRHMPTFWRDGYRLVAGYPTTEKAIKAQQDVLLALRGQVRMAHEMGIPILAGTDTLMPYVVPGDALWRELAQLALAMGSTDKALVAATLTNGRALQFDKVGVIKIGARADLLLLPNDPRDNLTALQDWRFVMQEGRLYRRADIDAGLAAFKEYFEGTLYRFVLSKLIQAVADLYQSADAAVQAQNTP